ncbi:hypothetical protein CEQ90_00920 [Lewinellaceae bacterium SD302]|nr:hypothetical protein CEQ90_00920 [Lewinellaceae bacterium SD302]
MYDLAEDYAARLEGIAVAIQDAEVLQQYLDEEEDVYYNALKEGYEPYMEELQNEIAANHPLQLIAFEKALLDERFEGLFLPRVLGYAVLRGEVNDYYKYVRQQEHFGEMLKFIAGNSNFDQLRNRIGQSIQVGFALSSDIWVTSLIESVGSKQVRQFLLGQKRPEHRVVQGRQRAYNRFKRQFKGRNFQFAEFPQTANELTFKFNPLKDFLLYRVSEEGLDNSSLVQPLHEFITNEALAGTPQLMQIATIYAAYFELSEEQKKALMEMMTRERKENPGATEVVLALMLELKASRKFAFGPAEELKLGEVMDRSIKNDLSAYFDLTDKLHKDGFVNPSVHEALATEVLNHPGLSDYNENLRQSVYGYFQRFKDGIGTDDYSEWFDLAVKQFPVYMKLFGNEAFNQQLRQLSIKYAKDLIKAYPDKRGKYYREIKKWTVAHFVAWNFMTEKQLKEFFKTPRKKKPVAE